MTDRRTTNHEEIESLLGAYALDAVDGDEAERVEAHLEECPRCAAEVASHREVAALLANGGEEAPAGLWERIADGLEEEPPPLDLGFASGRPATGEAADDRAPDEVAARRAARDAARSPAPRWLPAVAAAAAALVLGLVIGGTVIDGSSGDGDAGIAAPELESVARDVINNPDARRVELTGSDGGPSVTAAVTDDGAGYLLGTALPALGDDQTYQLWGISEDRVISLGTIGASPGVVAFHVDPEMTTLAVTAERAGGVVQSENDPVVVGALS